MRRKDLLSKGKPVLADLLLAYETVRSFSASQTLGVLRLGGVRDIHDTSLEDELANKGCSIFRRNLRRLLDVHAEPACIGPKGSFETTTHVYDINTVLNSGEKMQLHLKWTSQLFIGSDTAGASQNYDFTFVHGMEANTLKAGFPHEICCFVDNTFPVVFLITNPNIRVVAAAMVDRGRQSRPTLLVHDQV